MGQYFDRMKMLAEIPEFQLRIRFMLKDVIELRRDGWVPRKANSSEGPMPINQIRVDEKIRGGFPGGGMARPNPNAGLDGLFRNPLKTRAGLDDVLGVSNFSTPSQFLPHHDNYNKGSVNCYPFTFDGWTCRSFFLASASDRTTCPMYLGLICQALDFACAYCIPWDARIVTRCAITVFSR